ncbi:ATP-binding cassette domain-containing protein [Mesobaculum littorinae]|uniref:ATP-binding cassette domain-containing protein n=1 Tax=Mesobaculum littorinae TaxID=2486419 RepID=A0A438ADK1_9RHOB|nr:ATP-binding cassette domain-containing protein [Mesobaculum littorinae]RVV96780.1 ATP-binding cassette domain-containing protein [Mesobaculum littorinae]
MNDITDTPRTARPAAVSDDAHAGPCTGLHLDALRIRLGATTLVALDTLIAPGEVLSVMGPSGSGKSTLLNQIIGAPAPAFQSDGQVRLDGQDLTGMGPQARHIGLLFQDDLLFPHMSVGSNLAFALPAGLRGRRARRAAVEAALAEAGMPGYADRDPATLSGGQRSRVALMRTLLSAPRALLLDEPFSRLDADLRRTMRDLVFGEVRRRRLPTLLVTHDREDAQAAGGRILDPLGRPVAPPADGDPGP